MERKNLPICESCGIQGDLKGTLTGQMDPLTGNSTKFPSSEELKLKSNSSSNISNPFRPSLIPSTQSPRHEGDMMEADKEIEKATQSLNRLSMSSPSKFKKISPTHSCDECHGVLLPGEEMIVLEKYGKRFHPRHFRCGTCDGIIGKDGQDMKFSVGADSKFYHINVWQTSNLKFKIDLMETD